MSDPLEGFEEKVAQEITAINQKVDEDMQAEERDIRIGVGYDDEDKIFILRWEDHGKGFFESRMDQQNFEALTARLVRLLQEVNLAQAMDYQKRMADEKSKREAAGTEADAGGVQDLPCTDGQNQAEPEQPKND